MGKDETIPTAHNKSSKTDHQLDSAPKKSKAEKVKVESELKPKYNDLFKKELVRRIEKLSSESIQSIVEIVFGEMQDEN